MRVFLDKRVSVAGFLLAVLFVSGCAADPSGGPSPTGKDGAIFRHRWWNYYQRGLSAAENRDYSNAMADFEAALQRRDRDQRMARTYGMHFRDYFPHRELGILYWEKRRLAEAQTQLEISIAQAPTAKAFYYLDRVRQAQIRLRIEQDVEPGRPPVIRLDASQSELLTRDDPVIVGGTAIDPNYIASLTVDDQSVFLEGARQRVDFRQPFDLPQGLHSVRIRAESLSGLSSEETLRVRVDRQGPMIEVLTVEGRGGGAGEKRVLVGRAVDPSRVVSMMADAVSVWIPTGRRVPFRIPLDQKATAIVISAEDSVGNVTRSRLDVVETFTGSGPPPLLLASRVPLALLGRSVGVNDRQPPTIRLEGWTAAQDVYLDKVVIDGSVRDDRRIAGISINGQPVAKAALSGVWVAFSSSVALESGPNEISIAASDAAGNRTVERIMITRRTAGARLLKERLRISVLPFAQRDQVTATAEAFQDVYLQQLSLRNRFNLVDRSQLDRILQEHRISRTSLVAPETALQAGRLSAADAFVSGSIIDTRLGIEAFSQLVDTETAEVLTVVDAFIETRRLEHLKEAAQRLALKLHREFQTVDGRILERRQQTILTDLGASQLRAQRRVLVVRERPVLHPVTGHGLGSDYQVLGHARLVNIQEGFSKGELDRDCDPAVGLSHGVITQ
ncbi:MAG: CsgG/HfaB family protein [Desulfosarcina sp.]